MSTPAPAAFGPRWRVVPDNVSLAHLRRMEVRDPHLIAEVDGSARVAVQVPDRVRWTVGRDAGSDLAILWDGSVSRIHATIERIGSLVVVEDSGVSRNGTFVGGRRALGRTRLNDLDEVTLGNTTFTVRLPQSMTVTPATITVGRASAPANLDLTAAEMRVIEAMLPTSDDDGQPTPIPTNREIGDRLGVGAETVKSHLKSIARKLSAGGVRGPIDRSRLAELAAQGLLDGPPAA